VSGFIAAELPPGPIYFPITQRCATGELHWSETDYGDIVSWFSFAYAFGFLAAGRLLDRIGVKRGLGAAVVAWSIAAMAHGLARTAAGVGGRGAASPSRAPRSPPRP